MSVRHFAAIIGFCFMLVAVAFVVHMFAVLWVTDSDQLLLSVDFFGERGLELWLVFLGYCLVPITIYEFDTLLRGS